MQPYQINYIFIISFSYSISFYLFQIDKIQNFLHKKNKNMRIKVDSRTDSHTLKKKIHTKELMKNVFVIHQIK